MPQDAIVPKYLDRRTRLEQEIGTAREHQIRSRFACLHHVALKQG
jgi:23S rRNA-/tRNA-specific pseudouridylate synthase